MSRYPRGPVPRPVAREVNREAPERNCSGNLACFARNRPDRRGLTSANPAWSSREYKPLRARPALPARLRLCRRLRVDWDRRYARLPEANGHRKRSRTRPQDHIQGIAQHEGYGMYRRRRRLMETDIGVLPTTPTSASRCGVSGFATGAFAVRLSHAYSRHVRQQFDRRKPYGNLRNGCQPETFNSKDAGTDDEIYIGLWGTGGGREFPLSSKNHDDFERGADDVYVVGVDPGFGFPLLRPERSAPGEANDPALVPIDITSIEYVYVRKQAHGTRDDDDAWRLDSVFVLLYDDATVPLTGARLFTLLPPKGMWFGNEHGHQAWLTEARRPGAGARTFLDRLGPKVLSAKKRSVQSRRAIVRNAKARYLSAAPEDLGTGRGPS